MEKTLLLIPGMAVGTRKAIDALKGGSPGDVITRAEMERATGEACESASRGRSHVYSAINHVMSRFGVYWHWDRDIDSWKCCTAADSLSVVESRSKSLNRRARKSLRILATCDEENMSDDQLRDKRLAEVANSLVSVSVSSPFRKRLASHRGPLVEPDYKQLEKLFVSDVT